MISDDTQSEELLPEEILEMEGMEIVEDGEPIDVIDPEIIEDEIEEKNLLLEDSENDSEKSEEDEDFKEIAEYMYSGYDDR